MMPPHADSFLENTRAKLSNSGLAIGGEQARAVQMRIEGFLVEGLSPGQVCHTCGVLAVDGVRTKVLDGESRF
jgi:hypothetical protein